MVKPNKGEKRKTNPFLWFLFAIVIPIIVALTLAMIIFSVAGFDVIGWMKNAGNNVPVLSSVVTTDEERNEQINEEKMSRLLDSKDGKIDELNQEVANLEGTIEQLEQKIAKLEKNNENSTSNSDESEVAKNNSVKDISVSFKNMKKDQAALIIEKLDKATAVSVLKELSAKDRGEIFESMDAELAATLMKMFIQNQ